MEYSVVTALIDIVVIYAIVIVVSLLVATVIKVIVSTLSRRAERATAAAEAMTAAAPVAETGIPAHHLQAIAAAVALMSGAHRVVRIEPRGPSHAWTTTARTLQHGSHQPRRR